MQIRPHGRPKKVHATEACKMHAHCNCANGWQLRSSIMFSGSYSCRTKYPFKTLTLGTVMRLAKAHPATKSASQYVSTTYICSHPWLTADSLTLVTGNPMQNNIKHECSIECSLHIHTVANHPDQHQHFLHIDAPKIAVCALWNVAEGWLNSGSMTAKTQQCLHKHFANTAGLAAVPDNPVPNKQYRPEQKSLQIKTTISYDQHQIPLHVFLGVANMLDNLRLGLNRAVCACVVVYSP